MKWSATYYIIQWPHDIASKLFAFCVLGFFMRYPWILTFNITAISKHISCSNNVLLVSCPYVDDTSWSHKEMNFHQTIEFVVNRKNKYGYSLWVFWNFFFFIKKKERKRNHYLVCSQSEKETKKKSMSISKSFFPAAKTQN